MLLECSCCCTTQMYCLVETECIPAEERQSPELYAKNVRKLMGEALGAELSTHGIPQQQALKRNGIYVDWTGRCVMHCLRHFSTPVVKSAYDMSLQLAAGGESYLHASPVQGFCEFWSNALALHAVSAVGLHTKMYCNRSCRHGESAGCCHYSICDLQEVCTAGISASVGMDSQLQHMCQQLHLPITAKRHDSFRTTLPFLLCPHTAFPQSFSVLNLLRRFFEECFVPSWVCMTMSATMTLCTCHILALFKALAVFSTHLW